MVLLQSALNSIKAEFRMLQSSEENPFIAAMKPRTMNGSMSNFSLEV